MKKSFFSLTTHVLLKQTVYNNEAEEELMKSSMSTNVPTSSSTNISLLVTFVTNSYFFFHFKCVVSLRVISYILHIDTNVHITKYIEFGRNHSVVTFLNLKIQ